MFPRELTKSTRIKITVLYGVITGLSNMIAALIPITFSTPALQSFYMSSWVAFLEKYESVTNWITLGTFVIPSILCFVYARRRKSKYFYMN